jgi:hypothetical protein
MGQVVTAFLFLYHGFFGTCWGPTPWVYSSEVNSVAWRARGAGMATATNWLFGFVTVQFSPAGLRNLGWRFFLGE